MAIEYWSSESACFLPLVEGLTPTLFQSSFQRIPGGFSSLITENSISECIAESLTWRLIAPFWSKNRSSRPTICVDTSFDKANSSFSQSIIKTMPTFDVRTRAVEGCNDLAANVWISIRRKEFGKLLQQDKQQVKYFLTKHTPDGGKVLLNSANIFTKQESSCFTDAFIADEYTLIT